MEDLVFRVRLGFSRSVAVKVFLISINYQVLLFLNVWTNIDKILQLIYNYDNRLIR